MDYVFLIYTAEQNQPTTKEAGEEVMQAYGTYTKDLFGTGRAADCAALEPIATATTVRVRGGKRTVTDGPFAETREQLGGYYSFKTDDPEEALTWAEKIPSSKFGKIEVRPVMPMPMSAGDGPDVKKVGKGEGYKEYIFLIYDEEAAWAKLDPTERETMFRRYMEFTQGMQKTGQFVDGAPLQPVKSAKTVTLASGKRAVTDGPFAETREQLGGYYRIWAKNLDEAIHIATKIPSVEIGAIEVRPVMDTSAYV